MKKIWINKANSFNEADKFDFEYYLKMSSLERLEAMQFLRELNFKLQKGQKRAVPKRLRRIYKIIEQK